MTNVIEFYPKKAHLMSSVSKVPPITMSKLYLGNLPNDTSETAIKQLFVEQNLSCTNILVKRGGYAFVDCLDQSSADRAIDKLQNFNFNGAILIVEPSVAAGKRKSCPGIQEIFPVEVGIANGWIQTSKLIASNLSNDITSGDLNNLFGQYGRILSCEKIDTGDYTSQTFSITFEYDEEAKCALDALNAADFDGKTMKVEFAFEKYGRIKNQQLLIQNKLCDFPLRILVHSDMIGAIIGRQGATIRNITQQTRARVDVHRKDNVGSLEKAVSIYGNLENCTDACRRLLEVMQQEAINTNKSDVILKILAHNNLIGRIIGRNGANIKRIMQETNTKIAVSNINDVSTTNYERIISVKGSVENMSKAESLISAKLRQSYETDVTILSSQSSVMLPVPNPEIVNYSSRFSMQQSYQDYMDCEETTYLYIPNNVVGAIIGTKGSHIRSIIKYSGASVKIAPVDEIRPQGGRNERRVTIVGYPDAQWKAQYLIFEKVGEEGYSSTNEEVKLTTEIIVPSSQVGRIIGKGGHNIREIQRVSGSTIKLSEHEIYDDEASVLIKGNFLSVQAAQRKIRNMIYSMVSRSRSLRYIKSSSDTSSEQRD